MTPRIKGFIPQGGGFLPVTGFVSGSGGSAPPLTVPFDGATSILRPTLQGHYDVMQWLVPSWRFQLQEASGPLIDDVHDHVLASAGTVEYQVAGAGAYSSLGVATTEVAGEGFTAATGALWSCLVQPLVVYLEFQIRAVPGVGVNRSLVAFTGATSLFVATFNSSGQARLQARGAGGNVNGTQNYLDGVRHPMLIEIFPGPGILAYTTARYRISTDKEQINGTWAQVADATKGIATGGSGTQTAADAIFFDLMAWIGSRALTIGNTITPKVYLQRRGWAPTGY